MGGEFSDKEYRGPYQRTFAGRRRLVVAFCLPALRYGGPDQVVLRLLNALDRSRVAPELVVGAALDSRRRTLLPDDVPVHCAAGRPAAYPVVALTRTLRRIKPDIILCTLRMIPAVLGVRPFLPRRTAIVVRPANEPHATRAELISRSLVKHRVATRVERELLRVADGIVLQSTGQERAYAWLAGSGQIEVRRIPNPAPELPRDLPSLPVKATKGSPTLVSVGRLTRQKGHDVLLEAFARLGSTWPDSRLWILGEGPAHDLLRRLARQLGIDDRTDFLGHVPDVRPYLAAADLYVMASRYEGLSNALLEAQAIGLPAVATTGPSSGEDIVMDGVSGMLAEAATPKAVADAIHRALRHDAFDRVAISKQIQARFSAEQLADEYTDFLQAVADRRQLG